MLQFWKKSGQEEHSSCSSHCYPKLEKEVSESHKPNLLIHPLPLANFDDEGLFDIGEFESSRERSRLSKTLDEVLTDKSALTYFTQFMESRNASSFISCWLDIENFKSDLNPSIQHTKPHVVKSPVPNSQVDHDSLSVSTDCDSYTADSNSLCDYSSNTLSESKMTEGNCDSENSFRLKNLENTSVQICIENALGIFKKYIAQEAECSIKSSENVRNEVMENICNTEKVQSGACFDSVRNYIVVVIENEYFSAFLSSDYFCKHQIDVLTGGNVVLDDILYNETALFYFMEYLEQENQRSLLEFWIAASNFDQQLQDQKELFDPMEAQTDAVVLYDKYFSLQALCPLGFSDKVRLAVEQNICGENGLILECFHLPLKIVEKVLETNYLKPFLASQLFYKYLSDLISCVQSNGYATTADQKKDCPSDCSSERSFSQSTFLALEVPQITSKKTEKSSDMTIDTQKLYNPDALWKRKKFHRLSLGHINEIGKYEADFEPEPGRNEFRLKNVLKKVVNLEEEHKKKEEMAWQVAEMIVKDITDITLSKQNV